MHLSHQDKNPSSCYCYRHYNCFNGLTKGYFGSTPTYVAVNPLTNMVYVTNHDDNTVSVIDGKTNNVVKTIKDGKQPLGVAFDPKTNMTYVANSYDNTVSKSREYWNSKSREYWELELNTSMKYGVEIDDDNK